MADAMRLRRLLIANRGEIAVRVIRACRELGIESVAVYSEADAHALHVKLADRAYAIGPAAASESYLNIAAILAVATRAGVDAVHPGYGFLAENPEFAEACVKAGVIFVGPPADVIARMGSKLAARDMMHAAGVPVVPGARPVDQSDAGVRAAALAVGTPLLIKPSEGGGGKGMHIVRDLALLDEAIASSRREAEAAFGDGTLYIERLVERPRHVEFQVMADRHGHAVHLFERECSVQRRHQKVIEETPSPALTPRLRQAMGDAAVAAARAAGYENAGTIEFLLEGDGDTARFYFLEMNTRLQVEHPITEEVVGVDLVHAQLAVAAGEPLPWTQAALSQRGHAIECRVYAEDPRRGFLPQAGRLLAYREPRGPGLRLDSGVREQDEVTVHYDPLLAKLVARGESRPQAIARARAALRQFVVLGIQSNVPLLLRVLDHPRFLAGDVDTRFLDTELPTLFPPIDESVRHAAVAAAAWQSTQPRTRSRAGADTGAAVGAGTFGARGEANDGANDGVTIRDPWDALEWRA
jgi:3-methylcrotonyl-CoA carboxylase alpha subunit